MSDNCRCHKSLFIRHLSYQTLKSFLRISIRTWLMDQNPCETSHFLAIGVLTQRWSTSSGGKQTCRRLNSVGVIGSVITPLSRNENELFRELKRNETEQSSLPISTRLCRLQSK